MRLFVYCLNPIDAWAGWTPLREVLRSAQKNENGDGMLLDCWGCTSRGVMCRYIAARSIARRVHCEGDIRHGCGPFMCPIPDGEYTGEYLIAWKQNNNGTTFVASPFRLTWLEPDNEFAVGDYEVSATDSTVLQFLPEYLKRELRLDDDGPEAA
jgi:hypothetical protein